MRSISGLPSRWYSRLAWASQSEPALTSASTVGAEEALVAERVCADLAVEVWRLERRLRRLITEDEENSSRLRGISHGLARMQDILDEGSIQARVLDGERYLDGQKVEILFVENDEGSSESIAGYRIKETVEPAIYARGTLIRPAKVILHCARVEACASSEETHP